MTFILIAIACCLEIYLALNTTGRLALFVAEPVLPVALSVAASGKPESRRQMTKHGIEMIEQKISPRFRTNNDVEAKMCTRKGAVPEPDAPAFEQSFLKALPVRGAYQNHWYLRFLPVVNAAFTTALCRVYQL